MDDDECGNAADDTAPGLSGPARVAGGSGMTGTTEPDHRIVCHLDALLAERNMTLIELAGRAGVTVVNLSVLKNNRARAVRFSTLTAICDVLEREPGDLLSIEPG